jgi:hypothetical protein
MKNHRRRKTPPTKNYPPLEKNSGKVFSIEIFSGEELFGEEFPETN